MAILSLHPLGGPVELLSQSEEFGHLRSGVPELASRGALLEELIDFLNRWNAQEVYVNRAERGEQLRQVREYVRAHSESGRHCESADAV